MSSSAVAARGLVRSNTVGLRSGRRKRVTASIESEGRTLAVFQTLSGRDEPSRERSEASTLLPYGSDFDERLAGIVDRLPATV